MEEPGLSIPVRDLTNEDAEQLRYCFQELAGECRKHGRLAQENVLLGLASMFEGLLQYRSTAPAGPDEAPPETVN